MDRIPSRAIVTVTSPFVIIIGDTTFFSKTDGLTVFREPNQKRNLWWKFVHSETADTYAMGKAHLERNGFIIKAVVLDGRRGIRRVFEGIPTQMCHFHQKQIINRYLTTRPKLKSGQELRAIATSLTCTDRNTFTARLDEWYVTWGRFLKEKTVDPGRYPKRWTVV